MNPITDQDLVLFHFRDGLEPPRISEIEQALFYDAGLRLRLAALRETLSAAGEALDPDAPDAAFEGRVWQRLAPALPRRSPPPRAAWWSALTLPRLAFTSLLLASLGLGYLIGRGPVSPQGAPWLAPDASTRVLEAYLRQHLESAEQMLLVAADPAQDDASAARLARTLLETHRLYAQAAERAHRPALAALLRELEPVLLEVAAAEGAVDPTLREAIAHRDLAFRTRAVLALSTAPTPATASVRSL